jgi:UDP-N-acetylmuramoyl-L-alanyl-D-glutamate--2,6-diaminopimelate ligase
MQQLHTPTQAAQWLRERVSGSLCSDSRQLLAGDGFIAWPGAAVDARRFVSDAMGRGAAACLVEQAGVDAFALAGPNLASYAGLKFDTGAIASEFFGHPSRELALVAVTGTNGKTSTSWWLAQALSALPAEQALPCGVIGTLGIGHPGPGQTLNTGLTTPDPVLLQRTLHQLVSEGCRACAVEASSIGIEEHRLDGSSVRVAVFTNLTQDHLDYHGSMQAYWQSKRKLFSWTGLVSAVINLDDPYGAELAQTLSSQGLDVWSISCLRPARLQALDCTYDAHGLCFDVVEQGGTRQTLRSRAIGSYNVSNLLGVVAAMRTLGVALEQAVQACSALQPVAGRMECLGDATTPLVAVDYAHTPDALSQALTALRPLAQQRGGALWCLFGCGGDRDASKRPLMGAIASQKADQVVVTSDNPRSEKPESIIAQILLGLPENPHVAVQVDRALAIAQSIAQATVNDVLLLAGKGHEETQEIAGKKRPFSDKSHALKALQTWSSLATGVQA